jgi:hypothetical protein
MRHENIANDTKVNHTCNPISQPIDLHVDVRLKLPRMELLFVPDSQCLDGPKISPVISFCHPAYPYKD